MFEFRPHNLPRESTKAERLETFGAWFDADVDPAIALVGLVQRLGGVLERIVGADRTGPSLARLVTQNRFADGDWRELAEETDTYMSWRLGEGVQHLLAYGLFGVMGRWGGRDDDEATVEEQLVAIEAVLADCPPDRWLESDDGSVLLATAKLARGRWELDHGRNLEPEALALLGDVKMTRIRNMMSGSAPDLPRDEAGLIQREPALAWLMKREVFLPTIRDEGEEGDEPTAVERQLDEPVFVPVARDGSVFHPGLERAGGYMIGPKGAEVKVTRFDEALAQLHRMEVARWRRPSPQSGNWGIVAAVEWRRIERATLTELGST